MWLRAIYPESDRTVIPLGAPAAKWRRLLAQIAAAQPTLCIDFDGTMTLAGPYESGVPSVGIQPGLRQALAEWNAEGYRVVVLTARNAADVWPWLAAHGLTPFVSGVTNTKPPAVAYIDDRAVSFGGDWAAVRKRVRELAAELPAPPSDVSRGTPSAIAAADVHRRLQAALNQETVLCPHCGSSAWGLLAPGFETAKCETCGKNFQRPAPPKPSALAAEALSNAQRRALAHRPDPTPAQREAGNYRKAHVRVHGLDIAIENPRGSIRRGVAADGAEWATRLQHDYGYFKGTEGADGDHLDVFLGADPESSDRVFVINQIDPATGELDEHKVVLGATSEAEARCIYLANYDDSGPSRVGSIREMSLDEFNRWAFDGPRTVEAARLFPEARAHGLI